MGRKVLKAEGLLRLASLVLATMTALVVGLDAQTKSVFFMEKKATMKDLKALWILTIIASVAAGYQLIQMCRCFALAWLLKDSCTCNKVMAWIFFLLDQGVAYVIFSSTVAAAQASMIAVTGIQQLQWSKLCNIYTRFCVQIGGGILCGAVASLVMVVVSSVSAHHLFRLYPSYPPSSFRKVGSCILSKCISF